MNKNLKFNWVINVCFLFLGLIFVLFLGAGGAKAEVVPSSGVVINEVFYDPIGTTDTGKEWIEIYNSGSTKNLASYQLGASGSYYTFPDYTLNSQEFVVVHWNTAGVNSDSDLYTGIVTAAGTSFNNMSNTKGSVALFNSTTRNSSTIIDFLEYGGAGQTWETAGIWKVGEYIPIVQEGYSLERNQAGQDNDMATDFVIQEQPTPGIGIPESAIPESVNIKDPETGTDFVTLAWSTSEENDFTKYEIYQSGVNNVLGDKLGEIITFDKNLYKVDSITPGITYYFTVRNYNLNGNFNDSNQVSIIIPIVYSDDIIVNELVADPSGDEESEWIELYNDSDYPVDLIGWKLEDLLGSVHSHIINTTDDPVTTIGPHQHLLFYRKVTGITLNNDSDGVRLRQPNNNVISETSIYSNGNEGWSWAHAPGPTGEWSWTTKITPGAENSIILPADDTNNINADIPVNTTPVEVETGEVPNYGNYLVQITGTVTSTSGNTFYLDDGSGIIKVYIRDTTGIEKPSMHTGDTFTVVGLVDLYGNIWRILPQKQDDVKLIKCIKIVTIKKTTKKVASATKSTTADKISNASKIISTAKAVSGESTDQNGKTPFWLQIVETLVGLGVIGLVILLIVLSRRPKDPILGGHFGDDLT